MEKVFINTLKKKKEQLGEHHDLYFWSETLHLADVFERFRNMCIKIFELDPAKFISAPGLAWQAALKKTVVKLKSLADIDVMKKELDQEYVIQFIDMHKLIINI